MVATDAGDVRIIRSDPSKNVREVIFEAPTEKLNVSTDPRQQLIVPKSESVFMEDDLLIVEVKLTAASSVDNGLSTIQLPIRKMNLRTNQVYETYLRAGDIQSADTTVAAADVWNEIGSYTIGAKSELKFGHSIAENSRIYIDLVENA